MLDRLISFIGACGLLLAVTTAMPVARVYAASGTCGGTGCSSTKDDAGNDVCVAQESQPSGACTGDGCTCQQTNKFCTCKTG
jgi:hypothetical protein